MFCVLWVEIKLNIFRTNLKKLAPVAFMIGVESGNKVVKFKLVSPAQCSMVGFEIRMLMTAKVPGIKQKSVK